MAETRSRTHANADPAEDAPPAYGARVFLSRRGDEQAGFEVGLQSLRAFLALNRRMRVVAGLAPEPTVDRSCASVIRRAPR